MHTAKGRGRVDADVQVGVQLGVVMGISNNRNRLMTS